MKYEQVHPLPLVPPAYVSEGRDIEDRERVRAGVSPFGCLAVSTSGANAIHSLKQEWGGLSAINWTEEEEKVLSACMRKKAETGQILDSPESEYSTLAPVLWIETTIGEERIGPMEVADDDWSLQVTSDIGDLSLIHI